MQKNIWPLMVSAWLAFLILTSWSRSRMTVAQEEGTQGAVTTKGLPSDATAREAPSGLSEIYDREVNLESFEEVWQTVKDAHWDEKLMRGKWTDLRKEYRARAENAKSHAQMRKVIQSMVAELGQSHYSLIPAESYVALENGKAGSATSGLTLRMIGDEAVVTKVASSSSAAKAGVVPGWTLISFQGKDVRQTIELLRKAALGPTRLETLVAVTLDQALRGQNGEKLNLVMTNSIGETEAITLELVEAGGKVAKFGNLNPMTVTYESMTLAGGIGYFTFNLFLDPPSIMPAFRDTVRKKENSNGLIIDLRGNIGGIGAMTMGMASELSNKPAILGTMVTKHGSLKFAVNESPQPVTCPVAVLIDEVSISSAEVLSGGLQDIGVARVFGSRSAGLALPATVIRLPNGDGFMFAIANYVSASGKLLELEGVIPDEQIKLSKELLLSDRDPVLSRAVEWIHSENEKRNPS